MIATFYLALRYWVGWGGGDNNGHKEKGEGEKKRNENKHVQTVGGRSERQVVELTRVFLVRLGSCECSCSCHNHMSSSMPLLIAWWKVQVVVVTNTSLAEAIRIDEACRKQSIPFIRADTRGVFACVFCDFGQSFTVYDPDGEAFRSLNIFSGTWDVRHSLPSIFP